MATTSEAGGAGADKGDLRAWHHYLRAVTPYRALERARDELLAPLDAGQRAMLTADEQACLEGLTAAMAGCYSAVLAAEPGLVAAGRYWLRERPYLLDEQPALARLLGPVPPGQWEVGVAQVAELMGRDRMREEVTG